MVWKIDSFLKYKIYSREFLTSDFCRYEHEIKYLLQATFSFYVGLGMLIGL